MNNGTAIKINPAVLRMANIQEHGTAGVVNNKCQRGEFKRKEQRKEVGGRIHMKRKLPMQCELLLPGGMDLVTSLCLNHLL